MHSWLGTARQAECVIRCCSHLFLCCLFFSEVMVSGSCASCPTITPRSQGRGGLRTWGDPQEGRWESLALPGQCWPTCPRIKGTLGERPGLRVPGQRDPSSKRLGVALPSGVRERDHAPPHPRAPSPKCDPSLRFILSSAPQTRQLTGALHKPRPQGAVSRGSRGRAGCGL